MGKAVMTKWDRQVCTHLEELASLDNAGKIKRLSYRKVFRDVDAKIAKAEKAIERKTNRNLKQINYAGV